MNDIVVTEPTDSFVPIGTDLFDRWISYLDSTPQTARTYSKSIRRFLDFLTEKNIKAPLREDILAYKEFLLQSLKPSTVHGYITAVKLFFQWTEQEGIYPNVAQRVKGIKIKEGHKKDYLTAQQVSDLLQSIDCSTLLGARDYALLFVMVTTGLREASIIEANVEDIRTLGDSVVLFYRGKGHTEKDTFVKLAAPVESSIREYLKKREHLQPTSPLFCSVSNRNDGKSLSTRSISRIIKDRLISIGLKSERLTGHSLRHTAATLNLLNGGSLIETQQLLDHSNINTTLIYSHNINRLNNNSEERIADVIVNQLNRNQENTGK